MKERRKFIQSIGISVLGISSANWFKELESIVGKTNKIPKMKVIATWNNPKAAKAAWNKLYEGGSALDAVEAGAREPEADPLDTSVGLGGFPDRDGDVTLDACIMDHLGNAGAVLYLQDILHPVSVARKVLEKTPHVFLAGDGAQKFALAEGFEKQNLLTENAKKAWKDWLIKSEYKPIINVERHDTIGILAMDNMQHLSGACSTSGLAFKMKGRVGDSPIIGAGLYVDNEIGAATATGLGEAVIKKVGAFSIVEMMRHGLSPQNACKEAIKRLLTLKESKDMQVGYIAINKRGQIGAYGLRKGFQYIVAEDGKITVHDADSYFPY